MPDTSEPAVLIRGLTKSYGSVQALRGLDFEVQPGEVFGFLGPNGAGKTTTIRCLLDLIRPNGGTIRVLGIDPQADPVAVRARTGYLPGELALNPNLRVEAQLQYFNAFRSNSTDWEFVQELARRLDLDLKPHIKNLSHGNKQKVGIVQALMHRPDLLLLDEPTIGLDPLMQREVLRLISEAQAGGATVLFSSHIMSEVETAAERVAIINHGRIVEVAATESLINRALRRVQVRFREAVNTADLANISGAHLISENEGLSAELQVEGEMDALIKALAKYPVIDFETERPTLEEIFLAYYEIDRKEDA